jgi:hypothetical protein
MRRLARLRGRQGTIESGLGRLSAARERFGHLSGVVFAGIECHR